MSRFIQKNGFDENLEKIICCEKHGFHEVKKKIYFPTLQVSVSYEKVFFNMKGFLLKKNFKG